MNPSPQPSTPSQCTPLTPTRCIWSPFAPGSVLIASPFRKGVAVDPFREELFHICNARLSPRPIVSAGIACADINGEAALMYEPYIGDHNFLGSYYMNHYVGNFSSPTAATLLKDRPFAGNMELIYSPPVLTPTASNCSSTVLQGAKGLSNPEFDLANTGSITASAKLPLPDVGAGNSSDRRPGTGAEKLEPLPKSAFPSPPGVPCKDARIFRGPSDSGLANGHLPPLDQYSGEYYGNYSYSHGEHEPHHNYNETQESPRHDSLRSSVDPFFPSFAGNSNSCANGYSTSNSVLSASASCFASSGTTGGMAPVQRDHAGMRYCGPQVTPDDRIKSVPVLPETAKIGPRMHGPKGGPKASVVPPNKKCYVDGSFVAMGTSNSDLPHTPEFAEGTEDGANDCYADSDSSMTDCYTVRRKPCTNWAPEEDAALIKVVTTLGTKAWKNVAQLVHRECPHLPERTADQCSQHWLRVLDPNIVKGKWTPEDDRALIEAVKACPPKQWKLIANYVKGRTDIQVRYRMKRLAKTLLKRNIIPREKLP